MLIAALLFALSTASPVPVEQRGPAVGQRAPELHAEDQFGKVRTLASLQGKNGLVLLFVRSADW